VKPLHAVPLFVLGLAVAGALSGTVIADVTTSTGTSTTVATATTTTVATTTTTTAPTTTATPPPANVVPAGVRVAGVRVGTLTPADAVAAAAFADVIVINREINRLYLYSGTKLFRTFSVATGQSIYPTPRGRWHIVVKWKNPWWYPPVQDDWAKGLKPVPPGPSNPLGTRWMGLNASGVGIHGTDEPTSIGYSASHGCIRMQVPDAEWLFDHVDVGTTVYIV
jgi:lipoprotein-anchoring transpeptidase ErfK/SrfK